MVQVRINKNKIYNAVNWDPQEFAATYQLTIADTDLHQIKEDFSQISEVDILLGDQILATYNLFDGVGEIVYLGQVYDTQERQFFDCIKLTLTKANLIETIDRIDKQLNHVIDINTISIEELRAYKLKQVSEAATQDIYNGDTVVLPNGSRQKFHYLLVDQINLDELFVLAMLAPEMTLYPYHSSQNSCEFYDRQSVITIVTTLLLRKTRITTYCNQLNMYIRSLTDREELKAVEYGMELPQSYMDIISEIMAGTIEQMEKVMERLLPQEDEPVNSEN